MIGRSVTAGSMPSSCNVRRHSRTSVACPTPPRNATSSHSGPPPLRRLLPHVAHVATRGCLPGSRDDHLPRRTRTVCRQPSSPVRSPSMARDGGYRRWSPTSNDPPAWRAEVAAGRPARRTALQRGPVGAARRAELSTASAPPLWWSGAAVTAPRDRVVDLRLVLQLLVDHPRDCGPILDMLAVGCVVPSRRRSSSASSARPRGWEAYEVAGIRVTNRETSAQIDVSGGAVNELPWLRTVAAAGHSNGAHSPWPAPEERNRRAIRQKRADDVAGRRNRRGRPAVDPGDGAVRRRASMR